MDKAGGVMLPEGPAYKQRTADAQTPLMPFAWHSPMQKLLIDHLTTRSVVSFARNGVIEHVLRPKSNCNTATIGCQHRCIQ